MAPSAQGERSHLRFLEELKFSSLLTDTCQYHTSFFPTPNLCLHCLKKHPENCHIWPFLFYTARKKRDSKGETVTSHWSMKNHGFDHPKDLAEKKFGCSWRFMLYHNCVFQENNFFSNVYFSFKNVFQKIKFFFEKFYCDQLSKESLNSKVIICTPSITPMGSMEISSNY